MVLATFQATSLAASPLSHIVAVGTVPGYVFIVDLNKLDNPRVIARHHLHQGPVTHIM